MKRYERFFYIAAIMVIGALALGPALLAQSEQSIWRIAEQSENQIVLQRDAVVVDPTATSEPEPTATSEPEPTATNEPDPTATSEPEPTATSEPEPTATSEPEGNPTTWHTATDHEHGHAPPQWAEDWSMQKFGHGVVYGGDEATPNENVMKHNAYKGQIVPSAAGGEAYIRYHGASNPHERATRYHSYEVYYKDTAGNVSFFQGWIDTGDPATRRFPRAQGDPGIRPAMLVVDQASWNAGIRTEQWYAFAAGARLVEFGVNIGNSVTLWSPGEHLTDVHDPSTWVTTGADGTNRLVDFFLIESRFHGVTGDFCLTALGQFAECGADGALPQHIAPTMYQDMRTEFGVRRISGLSQVDHPCSACDYLN